MSTAPLIFRRWSTRLCGSNRRRVLRFRTDPSTADLIPQYDAVAACRRIIELLAGPAAASADRVRARAAFAVAQTVVPTLQEHAGLLDDATRQEIRAAALRALGAGSGS
jgi:hypothetical protein